LEKLPDVDLRSRFAPRQLLDSGNGFRKQAFIHIADGRDPNIRNLGELPDVIAPASMNAHDGNLHDLVRALLPPRCDRRRSSGRSQEMTAIHHESLRIETCDLKDNSLCTAAPNGSR